MDLLDLDGIVNGFRINGQYQNDLLGQSVSGVGDINGDGFDDVIISRYTLYSPEPYSSWSYVIFGTDQGYPADFDLGALDGSNGFLISGGGGNVSDAGDVNDDGFDDLIIGLHYASPNGEYSGASFVLFGAGSFTAAVDITAVDGNNGFRIDGEGAQDHSGNSASSAGDFNGDGFDDLLVGAAGVDANGLESGAAYVIYGTDEGYPAALDVTDLDGNNGFRINGEFFSETGRSVGNAGDFNGDGFDDLIIGASNTGSYIVFGSNTGIPATLELSTLDGSDGFLINGETTGGNYSNCVSGAGDINGDGFDDVIIGAPTAGPNGKNWAGGAYVLFGTGAPLPATFDLSAINGTNGFRIDGTASSDRVGMSVSSAGDFNGDGFDDLLIGAPEADPNGISGIAAGAIFVIFGSDAGFPVHFDLADLDYENGFRLDALTQDDRLGASVSSAGDVNGDGFDDLIVGAWGAYGNAQWSGAGYVIFGRASFITEGTSGADNITGTEFGDVIHALGGADTANGLAGDDIIDGGDGDDVLDGGEGDDTLEGGVGNDTLVGGIGDYSGYGNDTLLGGDGDDTLIGGQGVNTLDGGPGNDTVNYVGAGVGLIIHLAAAGTNGQSVDGLISDTLISIENVIGSDFVDNLWGNGADNLLTGGGGSDILLGFAGNDTLLGGDGNDQLDGGQGNDTINGGADTDTVTYVNATSAVTVTLTTGKATGGYGNDTLISVEIVSGSTFNDSLTGDGNANSLSGGNGNDTLAGGDGNDSLVGGFGNDTLNGGAGIDTAFFGGSSGVTVDLRITVVQAVGGGLGSDRLSAIENLNGSGYNDTLVGNNSSNTLNGVSGNDTLTGLDGNDTLIGGNGDDNLAGGAGLDTASYAGAAAAVVVDLAIAGVQNTLGAGFDTLVEIEYLTGSSHGDYLKGDGVHAIVLTGGAGNDYLQGGAGNDTFIGGAGFDVVSFAGASGPVIADLSLSGVQNTLAGFDQLVEIEYLIGSDYGDIIRGDGVHNVLLWGALGNDQIQGGAGDDYLVGGPGFDAVSFANAAAGVNVDLSITGIQDTGGAGLDTLVEMEYLLGSNFNDVLKGDGVHNVLLSGGVGIDVLQGGAGADYLLGGADTDTITGGAGADTLVGGAAADTFVFSNVSDFAPGPIFDEITDFSAAQNDKLDFSGIDADTGVADDQAFSFIGTAVFSNVAGQLRYASNGAGGVNVEGDTDGNGVADFRLVLDSTVSVTAPDFIL